MYQNEIEIIKSRIENKHQGDEKQLEIIFSPNKRLLVEHLLAMVKHIQW